MSDANGWPDASKPGVPMNPERVGAHALRDKSGKTCILLWQDPWWISGWGHISRKPCEAAHAFDYIGPLYTPSEAQHRERAAAAAAWLAARGACAIWHAEQNADARLKMGGEDSSLIRAQLASEAVMHKWYASQLRALPPPADAAAALAEMLERARREAFEEAARIADNEAADIQRQADARGGSHSSYELDEQAWVATGVAAAIRARAAGGAA